MSVTETPVPELPTANMAAVFIADRGKCEPISLGASLAAGKKVPASAINLLMQDHLEAMALFDRRLATTDPAEQAKVTASLCAALTAHMQVEEEIFYPAAQEATGDAALVERSIAEHEAAKQLVAQLQQRPEADDVVRQLQAAIAQHVEEEETQLFPEVVATNLDQFAVGARLAARRLELLFQLTGRAKSGDALKETHMTPVAPEEARTLFVEGLRNIHAVQKNAKSMLEKAIDRLENYPDVEARLRAHLGDKDREMERAETILENMGEERSGMKDAAMAMMGNMSAMMNAAAGDEILKNSYACFAMANMEIAAYESLLLMGAAAGETHAIRLLQQSLNEERAMAAWLQDNLKGTVIMHMQLRSEGRQAKH